MTKAEAWTLYATEVRSALGRRVEDTEADLMRELFDEDVSAEQCATEIENANETAYVERESDPECVGGMSRQDREDIRNAGRGHLLRIV